MSKFKRYDIVRLKKGAKPTCKWQETCNCVLGKGKQGIVYEIYNNGVNVAIFLHKEGEKQEFNGDRCSAFTEDSLELVPQTWKERLTK